MRQTMPYFRHVKITHKLTEWGGTKYTTKSFHSEAQDLPCGVLSLSFNAAEILSGKPSGIRESTTEGRH